MNNTKNDLASLIIGSLIGALIAFIFLHSRNNREPEVQVILSKNIETIYTGKSMYWKNDTLWANENHTEFLKVYPRELLELLKDK